MNFSYEFLNNKYSNFRSRGASDSLDIKSQDPFSIMSEMWATRLRSQPPKFVDVEWDTDDEDFQCIDSVFNPVLIQEVPKEVVRPQFIEVPPTLEVAFFVVQKVVKLGTEISNASSIIDSPDFRLMLKIFLFNYWTRQLEIFFSDRYHYPNDVRSLLESTLSLVTCLMNSVKLLQRSFTKKMQSIELLRSGLEMNPGPQKRINRRPRGRRRRRRNGDRSRQGDAMEGTRNVALTVSRPRYFASGMPSNFYKRLHYVIPLQQVIGGGTTNSLKFSSNAYDVDTALATTAMAYFSELAVIYSRFRTLGMHYSFRVSNSEAFPVQIIHGFSTVSFSATSLGANYAENRFLHDSLMSNVNGSRSCQVFRGHVHSRDLFGTVNAETDDLFTGSTTSSTLPSTGTAYIYIGGIWAAIPVAGIFISGKISLDIEFFRRNDIVS